jgi:surfactin synthase thioesterase subunit
MLDELPLNPNGKVDRNALAEYNEQRVVTVSAPPAGPVEERIAQVWREILGVRELNRTDDFFALGGDSFKAVRVARAMDTRVPVIEVFRHPTVAALAEFVAAAGDGTGRRTLIQRLTPDRADVEINLVCVPYGGGNAVAYQPLAAALGEKLALWSVDLPGHDLADPSPLAAIEEIAIRCAEEIRDSVAGPVALYGQCAGSVATVEIARRLEDIGVPVVATFIGAALPDDDPERSWRMIVDGTPDQLLGHLRRLGGFDGALDDEDISGILRVVHHDLTEAVRFYLREAATDRPPRKLSAIHCVVGDADPETANHAVRYRDWGHYASSATLSVVRGGGHYFCKHQPEAVAEIVTGQLAARAA